MDSNCFWIDIKPFMIPLGKNFLENLLFDIFSESQLKDTNMQTEFKTYFIYAKAIIKQMLKDKLHNTLSLNQLIESIQKIVENITGLHLNHSSIGALEDKFSKILEHSINQGFLGFLSKNSYSKQYKYFFNSKYESKKEIIRFFSKRLNIECLFDINDPNYNMITKYDILVSDSPNKFSLFSKFIYVNNEKISITRKIQVLNDMDQTKMIGQIMCLSQLESTLANYLSEKRLKVGYNLKPYKFKELQIDNHGFETTKDIEFIPIDLRIPSSQHLDIFIHNIIGFNEDDDEDYLRIFNLKKICNQKNILLMDPIEFCEVSKDRTLFTKHIQELFQSKDFLQKIENFNQKNKTNHKGFKLPSTLEIYSTQTQSPKLEFPFILKPIKSSGTAYCHQMALILTEEGYQKASSLEAYRNSHIMQEFIDHDEKLIKVYVVGKYVEISQKKSVPNMKGFETDSNKEVDVDVEFIKLLTEEISENFRLSLYGLDLIKSVEGEYFLIDLNYLPGFKKFKEFKDKFHNHILETYKNWSKRS